MKRLTFIATMSALAVATAAPTLAKPGGGGGGDRGNSINAGANAGGRGTMEINRGMGTSVRDSARANSRGSVNASDNALGHANSNSALSTEPAIGTRIPESATRVRGKSNMETGTMSSTTAMASTKLTGVETGMTVNDSGGAAIGTVTGITTKGNGSIRTVQVTLTNGQIITLAPSSLTLDGDVLTTTSTTSNFKSQGAAHANINGLIHASPNSALASAGVTSLTGLATDLTVNTSGGTAIGTVDSIVTNRSGAVVGINVDLSAGGTVFIPATTLSMDGTTVITSSTQF